MTLSQTNQVKGIAIVFMMLLHLFNTYVYADIYDPYLLINSTPLTFYISLFADCCVVMFLFCSGYGLYHSYKKCVSVPAYIRTLPTRIKRLYVTYWIILMLIPLGFAFFLNEPNYPGDSIKFLLNFSGLDTSYNGAWWFFTTYVICVLVSPIIFKMFDRVRLFWIGLYKRLPC